MTTIVFAHPWHGSFNYAILNGMTDRFDGEGRAYQVIDLMADGFNPALTAADLALYSKGGSNDPLVKKYSGMLHDTSTLILIFPIWWGMVPADLKGFFDKVFLPGDIYSYNERGEMVPGLKVEKTYIITTSQSDTEMYRAYIEDHLVPYVLNPVGIAGAKWFNCDRTAHGRAEHRLEFLDMVVSAV